MQLRIAALMALFSAEAFASASPAAGGAAASPLAGIMPFVLIAGIMYLLIIRPQSKKYKEHQAMLNAIVKGDEIVTGGIHGKVTRVEDGGVLKVEIASGVEVMVEQSAVTQVKNKKAAAVASAEKPAATAKGKAKKAANDNG